MSLPDNEAVFNFSEAKNGEGIRNEKGGEVGTRLGRETKTFMAGLGAGINESIKDLILESQTFPKSHGILIVELV